MKRIIAITLGLMIAMQSFAADYMATVWGAKSDGITDNTGSIQKAIDFISEHGGGTLSIYVGRYVTGAIELKDNVTLYLGEGCVLVAPTNIYAYKGAPALIWAKDRKNVAVTGKGVIECRLNGLEANVNAQVAKGYLPEGTALPTAFKLDNCTGAGIGEEIKVLRNTAASTQYNK